MISRQEWEDFRDNFYDANKEWHCSVYIEGQKRTHRLVDLPLVRKEMEEEARHNADVALMVRNRRLWKSLMCELKLKELGSRDKILRCSLCRQVH
jgi:hypothetical protein